MAVSLTVLGSGSRGNCAVLSGGRTSLLVDAGFSCRETLRRMRAAALDPASLHGILISHEHSDHISGAAVLSRQLKLPVYVSEATHQAWTRYSENGLDRVEYFSPGCAFQVGDISVLPFTIPHDAADPVGFSLRSEGTKLVVVTDLGYVPPSVADQMRGCNVLMVESNHDLEMLRGGPYPWAVKQRVMSRVGHLSNEALADFLLNDYDGSATFLVLAHLSEQNNHPDIARREAQRALRRRSARVTYRLLLASQTEPLEAIRL
jgi:phosphoribosyl 1,2-cyclic phosphodiesterase